MTFQGAYRLQKEIASTHPLLEVSIKKVGQEHTNEWVCFIENQHLCYYLWNEEDWQEYKNSNVVRLFHFTNEGKAIVSAKIKASRKANRQKQATLSA